MTGLSAHSPGLGLSEGFREQTEDQTRTQKTERIGKGKNGKENTAIADRTRVRGEEEDPKLRASRVRDGLDRFRPWHLWQGGEGRHDNPGHREWDGQERRRRGITLTSSKALIAEVSLIIKVISCSAVLPVGK